MQTNTPWYRKRGWIITFIVIGILCLISIANAIASGGKGVGNTDASTSTPTPTVIVSPTPTPRPTPTPKPLSPTQRSVQIAQDAGPFGKQLQATWIGSELHLSEYLDTNNFFNNGAILTAIHSDCFNIFQHEYSYHWPSLSTVHLVITAPLQDQYGNTSTGKLAECDLDSGTAHKFNWSNLDQDSAWPDYDYTWTLPSLGS